VPLLKYLTLKALRYGSHSVTCELHHTCLYLVSIHQMAHHRLRLRTSNCSLLLIYLPRKNERLSWHGWLLLNTVTTYGFCHKPVHFSGIPPGQAPSSKVLQKGIFLGLLAQRSSYRPTTFGVLQPVVYSITEIETESEISTFASV